MAKKISSTVKIFTLIPIPIFIIILLALTACSSSPEITLELRLEGSLENIAGETVAMGQGGELQFIATLLQDGVPVTPEPDSAWEIVEPTRGPAQRNGQNPQPRMHTISVYNGRVTSSINHPPGTAQVRVAQMHNGQNKQAYANIIVEEMPNILINESLNPQPITIEAEAIIHPPIVASLSGGEAADASMLTYTWMLVYANGRPVSPAVATLATFGNNNEEAVVTINNRLAVEDGILWLNVTAPRATPNNIQINAPRPGPANILINGYVNPAPVTIGLMETATATFTASLPNAMQPSGNYMWMLVYANGGVAVPWTVAEVETSGPNQNSARVRINNRGALASGALKLNVIAPGMNPNVVAIDVEPSQPQFQIPAVGQTFADPDNANLEWRVLADYNANNHSYALLIAENVWSLGQETSAWTGHANNRWNETNVFRHFENAYLKRGGHLGNWYQNTVGATIKAKAVNYNFLSASGIEFDMADNTNTGLPAWTGNDPGWRCNRAEAFTTCAWTRAISRPSGNPGNGGAFILSQTEVQTFFGPANANPTNADRQATGDQRHGWASGHTYRAWWMRSPGNINDGYPLPVRFVFGNGSLGANNANDTGIGSRPALWVRR